MNEIQKDTSHAKITIDSVEASKYQKSFTLTAQLRQIITTTTTYPATQISDGVSDNLFDISEFSIGEGETFENLEKRVAFINVPENATVQMLQMKLKALYESGKNPCICKVISNEPILTENQKVAIRKGLKTKDDFANSQVVRYGTAHKLAGSLILDDKGNPMYKRTFFKEDQVEDENSCGSSDVYISEKIQAEMGVEEEEVLTDVGLF